MNESRTYRPIALALLLAAAAAFAAVVVHEARADRATGHNHAAHATTAPNGVSGSEFVLRQEMRRLWEDHVTWTRLAVISLTSGAPDTNLYTKVLKQYAPDIPLGSFSQFGFLEARIATDAMLGIKGDVTKDSVNEAFKNVKGFKTDILCKPWYYGDAPLHIPNNTDRTVTPQGGKMVQKEDCFPISDVDPAIKQVRDIEAKQGS